MTPFEFLLPYSLEEALALLDAEDPDIRPVGGGTAVMLMMKAGVLRPTRLVSLQRIGPTHSGISVDSDGQLVIGGLATLAEIERHQAVRQLCPLLSQVIRGVANARVRAVATIGGNISHADPHLDLPPVLAALEANISVTGPNGARLVPAAEFCTGYYETVVQRDELVTQVLVPPQTGPGAYLKMTTRATHDWPALGLAVVLNVSNGIPAQATMFVGAATDRPTRLLRAEAELKKEGLEPNGRRLASEAAASEVTLMGDSHGSAAYKSQLLKVAVARAIDAALSHDRSHG